MKPLIFAVLVIGLLAAALALVGPAQWAGVTLAFGDVNLTTNFAVLILALIGLFIVLRLLGALLGLPSRLVRAGRTRRLGQLREEFEQGIAFYLQGRWRQAHKCFLRAARAPALAHSASLLAACCAVQDNAFKEARAALQTAREVNVKDDFCSLLIQSEVLFKSGQARQAAEHLDKLRRRQPDNRKVTDLLMQACTAVGEWEMLAESLPQLRKLYAHAPDKLRAVEIPIARKRLHQAAERMDENALERCWRETGAAARPALLTTYAQMLVKVGARKTAERVLREAIESNWDEDCVAYYGGLESGDIDERLKHAERWLKSRPKDPALLLCLGKLYRQVELWDQAKHYLKASFSLAPKPETFRELSSVVDYVGGGRFD